MSFLALQKLLLRNTATDGEQFVKILRNRGSFGIQLQTLDPDLLDHQLNQEKTSKHGEIRLGVECDRLGRPLAYWFRESYDLGASLERIPASDIIHICRPDRLNQTRGVSWFSPVLVPLKMLDGLYEAILILNRLAASKMGFFVHKDAGSFDRTAYDAMSPVEAEPGSTIALPPGIEFQSWDTGNPSAELNAFSKLILRHIASGLKVSYVALSNDLEGVNYSSIRAGLLVERDQFRTLQQWWIDTFLRPVYVEWLKSASLSESWVILGRDWRMYQSVHFVPRGWPWVDPLKDIQATLLAINNNLGSRTDALAEGGKDIEEVFEKIAAERGLAAEFGIDLTIDDTKPQPDAEDDEEEPVVMAGGQSIVYNMTRKP
jgi:lambda family phage portal protein